MLVRHQPGFGWYPGWPTLRLKPKGSYTVVCEAVRISPGSGGRLLRCLQKVPAAASNWLLLIAEASLIFTSSFSSL